MPAFAGFLGVELTAKDMVLAHGGDEHFSAILRDGMGPLSRIWLALWIVGGAIRVHKVIVEGFVEVLIVVVLTIEEMDRIPSHVRDGLVLVRKRVDLARNDAQSRDGALGRGLEEDLHADAYPKYGRPEMMYCRRGSRNPREIRPSTGSFESSDAGKR